MKPKQTRSEQAKRKAEVRKLEEAVLRAAETWCGENAILFNAGMLDTADDAIFKAVGKLRTAKARAGK